MSIEQWSHPTITSSVTPLLLPSVFPSISIFSKELALHIKCWSIEALASAILMNIQGWFILFFLCSLYFYYYFLIYNSVLVLPYIDINPPRVYMSSQCWTPFPPPSPYHLSGSSQCTSPKHPVSLLTGLISLQSKGLSGVFSSTTFWKHLFFSIQPSLWSNSHICT